MGYLSALVPLRDELWPVELAATWFAQTARSMDGANRNYRQMIDRASVRDSDPTAVAPVFQRDGNFAMRPLKNFPR